MATVEGLPRFLYVGERLTFSVNLRNESRSSIACRLIYRPPQGAEWSTGVPLSPGEERRVVCDLTVTDAAGRRGHLECRVGGNVAWRGSFRLRDGRGDVSGVRAQGRELWTADGERVVLVNEYERESDYQRWLFVRWAKSAHAWPRSTLVCSVTVKCFSADGAEGLERELSSLLPARDLLVVDHSGSPIDAALTVDRQVPEDGPAILCLCWGFHEALGRFPLRDFTRALDLAIDRARRRNRALQVVLVTPPPAVGEEAATARFAEAIRKLAREHHAVLVDLHAAVVGRKRWEELYRVEGDPAVLGLYPAREGQALLRRQLAEALR